MWSRVTAAEQPRRRQGRASLLQHCLQDDVRSAYNAGPTRVRACGCVPPIPETQSYVADILGLLHGAGDPAGDGADALEIRLVR